MSWWRLWMDDLREFARAATGARGFVVAWMALLVFATAAFAVLVAAAAVVWLIGYWLSGP